MVSLVEKFSEDALCIYWVATANIKIYKQHDIEGAVWAFIHPMYNLEKNDYIK